MPKSRFFRVATEGQTVDGRTIERKWLQQMADNYDPETFTARVNCEHIAGFSPDRPFNSYGSVTALDAREVTLNIAGQAETRLALYAEIDANDQLVEINKAGQKLFSSCEIHPDFAGKGEAYLVGLAVTDRPASLGTEPLHFAASARSNVFTPALDVALELLPEDDAEAQARAGLFSAIAALFKTPDPAGQQAPDPAPESASNPQPPANDNAQQLAAFAAALGSALTAEITAATAPLQAELNALQTRLLEPQDFTRALATGRTNTALTDC